MPLLDAFYRQRKAQGWQVLGLAVDQAPAVQKFLQRLPVTFPIGMAGLPGVDLSRALGNATGGLPFTVVFSPEGEVAHRQIGKLTTADLERLGGLFS
jgi:peroxiredoxin